MKAIPKPEIEHFKKFHLLDLMSARHLNYLREKSLVVDYAEGAVLFEPPRSRSMGYYLLEGKVQIRIGGDTYREISSGSSASYCSLEDKLPEDAVAVASTECRVLQLSRVLVEQYFSWSTTGEYKVVDVSEINQSVQEQQASWMRPILESTLAKNINAQKAKELFLRFEEVRVREGDILIHKGESNQHFYILKLGEATCIQPDDSVQDLSVGCFFGEESLVPDAASSIQVEMKTQGVIARLSKKNFNSYIKKSLIKHIEYSQLSLMDSLSYKILDVRLPAEYKCSHTENAVNIPVSALRRRLDELDKNLSYFISAESGARGELASYILQQEGYRAFVLFDNNPASAKLIG